jgi:hypothetical protein
MVLMAALNVRVEDESLVDSDLRRTLLIFCRRRGGFFRLSPPLRLLCLWRRVFVREDWVFVLLVLA